MNRLTLLAILLLAVGLSFGSAAAQKKTIGIICDRGGQAIIFDAEADVVTGTVPLAPLTPYSAVSDCAIMSNGKLAFVSDFEDRVWVIDLTLDPPALAAGKNPIPVSTWALEMEFTPDEKYLLVGNGYSTPSVPLSVVDIATRTQVDTFYFGTDTSPCSVASGPDGLVLVATGEWKTWESSIRRLCINASGKLTDTGQLLTQAQAPYAGNVLCVTDQDEPSAGKPMGIFLCRGATQRIGAFQIDGMVIQSTATPSGAFSVDGFVRKQGNRLFVRSNQSSAMAPPGPGLAFIDVFKLHIDECRIGDRVLTIPLDRSTGTLLGLEQMAIHPNGKKLYVSGLGLPEVRVYDARTGDLLRTINYSAIMFGLGMAVARQETGD